VKGNELIALQRRVRKARRQVEQAHAGTLTRGQCLRGVVG
jgi:hypothetical protein